MPWISRYRSELLTSPSRSRTSSYGGRAATIPDISATQKIMRLVSRHPVASTLGVVLAIGGVGALVDTLGGSAGAGAPLCGVSAGGGPGQGREQKDAGRNYLSVWTRAAPFLGSAGEPPPRLGFVDSATPKPRPRTAMWVGPDESNCRTIFITPGARSLLARSQGSPRERRHHRAAERWALHETAHYFQSDEVLFNPSLREYGATQWEKAHSRRILGTHKRKAYARYNQWRDREQFGSNYGGSPLTFVWPGAPVDPASP